MARLDRPFDHDDWVFEPKLDGFRALAYIEGGKCSLISRNGNRFKTFADLCASLAQAVSKDAIIDGEIVYLGPDGKPQFYNLMRRHTPQHFYAFDVLWIGGHDLRHLPLLTRKRLLREIMPSQPSSLLYVKHVAGSGIDLFGAACAHDLEGVVAKLAVGRYDPGATSWVKIKNRRYSQAEGRHDFFDASRRRSYAVAVAGAAR